MNKRELLVDFFKYLEKIDMSGLVRFRDDIVDDYLSTFNSHDPTESRIISENKQAKEDCNHVWVNTGRVVSNYPIAKCSKCGGGTIVI